MNKHTPAPWKVLPDTKYPLHQIWSQVEFPVFIARTTYAPQSEANARLIAAAPEMYALIKEMADKTDIMWQRDYGERIKDLFNKIDQS